MIPIIPDFPKNNHYFYPFSTFRVYLTRNINVSSRQFCVCLPLFSLSPSASPSRSPIPGPWCCVDFSGGPVVCCQNLSKMLELPFYIPVAA